MADSVIPAGGGRRAPQPQPKGPGGRLWQGIFKFLLWILLGLAGNVLIEWLCMGILWPGQGVARCEAMLEAEIRYLEQDLRHSVITDDPGGFAAYMANNLNWALFKATGLEQMAKYAGQETTPGNPANAQATRFQQASAKLAANMQEYLLAAMIATHVFALRLSVLVLSMPVFVLAGLIGGIDGMVQRDVNRWAGGRELGQRYHLAKGLVGPGLALPWIIYLAWPTTVHPYLVILPFALLFGLAVAVTAATFKKYF